KATEQNSDPLFGWLPLKPSLKRSARVEIHQIEGLNGILPIAVRAPVPVSTAAIFYNEANGNILGVKYFVQNNTLTGIPGGLQGWSTFNSEDPNTWSQFSPPAGAGVAIAVSFRGACASEVPAGNTKITV